MQICYLSLAFFCIADAEKVPVFDFSISLMFSFIIFTLSGALASPFSNYCTMPAPISEWWI
jgi:hypothetical protein